MAFLAKRPQKRKVIQVNFVKSPIVHKKEGFCGLFAKKSHEYLRPPLEATEVCQMARRQTRC
jgi:hypothetical protein